MVGRVNVSEIRELGYSYVNAANFMTRVAREQEIGRRATEKYNESLQKQKKETDNIQALEAELARLQAKLAEKRSV